MGLTPLSDEEVANIALSMSSMERSVIRHFVNGRGRLYRVIAEKSGASYADVQLVGQKLQRQRLAYISVIPYDGCRLFLNVRGEQIKRAIEILDGIEESRAAR
ncbi:MULTISPECIES: hypothetical protein [Sphingomonas]|uniref:hypothetical protein n=1 Tax=Sphingomonas TaxID=13687 RepID=UPI001454DC29|nr:hypothetical protein [Sphingomonas sp. CCH10-B3]